MNYFRLLHSSIESPMITEQKEIIDTIMTVANLSSKKTAKKRLDSFHDVLRTGSDNPAFAVLCNKLDVPEELLPIYRKMAHFVLFERYVTIKNKKNSREMEINEIKFLYKVPLLFMPILISFIDAMHKNKPEKNLVASFFGYMDVNLAEHSTKDITEKYSCGSTESLIDIYKDWTTTYLGKNYFIHLEELFNECAKSQYQRNHLQNATLQLTAMAAPPISFRKIPSEQDIAELDRLLTEYKTRLTDRQERQGIDSLYMNQEAVYLESERACINDACMQFKKALKGPAAKIKDFIIQNHKSSSLYKIAIRDFDRLAILEKQVSESLSDAQTEIISTIENYYTKLAEPKKYEDVTLQSLYDSKKLIMNKKNTLHKKNTLKRTFDNAFEEVSWNLKDFFKDVRDASGNNASRFSAATTEEHFKKIWITDEIKQIWEKTIENIEKENLLESCPW